MTSVFSTDTMAHNPLTPPGTEYPGGLADRKPLAMPTRIAGYLKSLPGCIAQGALVLALLPALGGEGRAQQMQSLMQTELFEIALVHNYTEIWRDSGSRAKRDVLILRPDPPAGFRTLGDVAIEGKAEDIGAAAYPYTLAIKARPGFEKLLANPTGVIEKWSTSGSRADVKVKVYGLACPVGFSALGGYVQRDSDRRSNDNITCISTSVLARGTWALESVWDDKGTGADKDVSLWTSEYRGAAVPHTLIIPSNAFMASTTHDKPTDLPWLLKLTHTGQGVFAAFPAEQAKNVHPTLTGPDTPMILGGDLPPVEYEVPFYQVKDPDLSFFEQWMQSPVYTVRRTAKYEHIRTRDNTGNCKTGEAATFTYKVAVGTETSFSWNWSASASVTVEGKGSFKPFGVGGELSVAVGVTAGGGQEWGSTESKTTEIEDQIPVPAGTAMALFQLQSDYQIYRKGSDIPMPNANAKNYNNTLVWAYYRLPGWTKENGCPRTDVLISGPVKLDKDRKYYSESGLYHLLWDDRDFAVYTDSGNAVWKFSDQFQGTPWIKSIAVSEDGQITLMAGEITQTGPNAKGKMRTRKGDPSPFELVKSANRPKGTAVYLTEDGALQVVAPTGRVVWDSTAN